MANDFGGKFLKDQVFGYQIKGLAVLKRLKNKSEMGGASLPLTLVEIYDLFDDPSFEFCGVVQVSGSPQIHFRGLLLFPTLCRSDTSHQVR